MEYCEGIRLVAALRHAEDVSRREIYDGTAVTTAMTAGPASTPHTSGAIEEGYGDASIPAFCQRRKQGADGAQSTVCTRSTKLTLAEQVLGPCANAPAIMPILQQLPNISPRKLQKLKIF
jgi:hypothetical protein